MTEQAVQTGVSVLCATPTLLSDEQIGLVTNFTGTTPRLDRNVDEMLKAGIAVKALFGPEHGLRGTGQAGESESESADPITGIPVLDTYGRSGEALDELVDRANVDTLVFDMQDVGTRYWTYTWTMYDCMASAARMGKRFVVLDRPNPIGGLVTSGAGLDRRFASFVGRADVRQRHGLTSGELALLFNRRFLPTDAGAPVDLRVVEMTGWARSMYFDATGLPWVAPSPNLPTLDSALAFSGTGLFEGTNVSEGRGTTRPFELIGAPYVDGQLISVLRDLELPGVTFREAWFAPTFHKYSHQVLRGVQLHVSERSVFDPVACGISMLSAFARTYPNDFAFLPYREASGSDGPGFTIDRLWGSDALRKTIEANDDPTTLMRAPIATNDEYNANLLLY